MAASKGKVGDIELRPDGWKRFERAVDIAMKTPAKHKPALKPKAKKVKHQSGK